MKLSPSQLNALSQFNDLVKQLEDIASEITERLLNHKHQGNLRASISELPRYTKNQEGIEIESADPVFLTGDEAVQKAIKALSDWFGEDGYSTKFCHRTPGAIIVSEQDDELAELFEQCNSVKQGLSALLPQIGDTETRFEAIHRYHPMLITLQLVRQITVDIGPPGPESITFSWGSKPAIYKLKVEDAIGRLNAISKHLVIHDESSASRYNAIQQDILAIQSLPAGAQLRLRRDLPPKPLMNIRWPSINGTKAKIVREGHTPLVVLGSTASVKIGALKPFCREQRKTRAKRKDPRGFIWEQITHTVPIFKVQSQEADTSIYQ